MILLIVVCILTAVIFIQEIIHFTERKDLYNRLMSRDLHDYKSLKDNERKHIETAHERALARWRDKGGGSE